MSYLTFYSTNKSIATPAPLHSGFAYNINITLAPPDVPNPESCLRVTLASTLTRDMLVRGTILAVLAFRDSRRYLHHRLFPCPQALSSFRIAEVQVS